MGSPIEHLMTNDYSTTWFDTFLQPHQLAAQTEREIDFIVRHLPRPAYTAVLDLCCGVGRHTSLLAQRGYRMLGLDRSRHALDEARRISGANVTYVEHDMRRLEDLPGSFDAVVCLWQSFGYFDEATNGDVIRQIAEKLNPCGRLILDIYHRAFFEQHQGTRTFEKDGLVIAEHKHMRGERLVVELAYGDAPPRDIFDWQLYTPDEIRDLAAHHGLHCVAACCDFDEHQPPAPSKPRMQLVFEKHR